MNDRLVPSTAHAPAAQSLAGAMACAPRRNEGSAAAAKLHRVATRVRALISATNAVRRVAREVEPACPAGQAAQLLCEGVLREMRALSADTDDCPPHTRMRMHHRLEELLAHGQALADAFHLGAFDGDVPCAALNEHARRLGERYVTMLEFGSLL